MAMLELECPSCGELLELDAGFAGGVCRCSSCGKLMSVPGENSSDDPQLIARPGTPGKRPDSPTSPRRSKSAPAASTGSAAGEDEADVDPTAISENAPADIPTAHQRRTGVRAITVGVFVAAMLAVVGICVVAIIMAVNAGDGVDATQIAIEQFGYDPNVNPFELQQPNALGLSLTNPAVVIVDNSGASRTWLSAVNEAIRKGLAGHSSGAKVGVILATEEQPIPLSTGLVALGDLTESRLENFQQQASPTGVAPLDASLAKAISWQPAHVVLITGQWLTGGQIEDLNAQLAKQPGVKFDIVLVGEDISALEELAQSHDGRYVQLAPRQIQDWYRSAAE